MTPRRGEKEEQRISSLLLIIITATDHTCLCAWLGARPALNPCENLRRKAWLLSFPHDMGGN